MQEINSKEMYGGVYTYSKIYDNFKGNTEL